MVIYFCAVEDEDDYLKDATAAEEDFNVQDMLDLRPERIQSVTFPSYADPYVKDDMVRPIKYLFFVQCPFVLVNVKSTL